MIVAAVLFLVKDDAQRLQAREHDTTHAVAVFADACGKHDRVATGHFHEVLTKVFTNGVRVHLVGEHRALVAFFGALAHVAHIVADA